MAFEPRSPGNFDLNAQISPTVIADVMARRKQQEMQMEEAARKKRLSEMKVIGDAVSQSISGMIEASKAKQKKSFIDSLANSLITTEALKPNADGTTAAYDPDKADAIRAAVYLTPEEFAKQSAQSMFPKTRTGTAPRSFESYIVSQIHEGKLDPEEGAKMLGEYKPSNVVIGYTDDGRPIFSNTKAYRDEGKPISEGEDPVFPKPENIPTSMVDSLGELAYSHQTLDRIMTTFNETYVGPVAAKAGKMSAYLDSLTDDQRVEFYGNIAEYKNSIIKAITGAQMSEIEARRIIQQIPDENTSPKAFIAALKRTYLATNQRIKAKEKALKVGGYVSRGSLAKQGDLEKAFNNKLKDLNKKQKPPQADLSGTSTADLIRLLQEDK